jgi:hypothetical protein
MRFLVRVSLFVLVVAIEFLKDTKNSGQVIKTYGVQPNINGKYQRVRNDV